MFCYEWRVQQHVRSMKRSYSDVLFCYEWRVQQHVLQYEALLLTVKGFQILVSISRDIGTSLYSNVIGTERRKFWHVLRKA